jgi:hypothetical protein
MILAGGVGLFVGKPTDGLILAGAGQVTLIVGIMVAGKVVHDKGAG